MNSYFFNFLIFPCIGYPDGYANIRQCEAFFVTVRVGKFSGVVRRNQRNLKPFFMV